MSFRLIALLATLGGAVVLLAGTGAAGAAATQSERPDLSSAAAINTYLRSIGVNPRTVVVQRGMRNYAGPRCPGKGWNCTTRTRVLQVGSQNTYECIGGTGTGATGGTQTCSGPGLQSGDKNTFRCIERTSVNPAVQDCTVTQNGPSNYALVEQVADLSGDPDQDATQTASITQTGSGKNEVHIHQRSKEYTTAPGTTTQDAHQVAVVTQTATGTAKNFSDVHEYMDLRGSGGTSQSQNEGSLSEAGVTDCASGPESPAAPNQCANIRQTADAAGSNLQHLHQLIDEDEKSSTATDQDQGQFSGGIDSEVHQDVLAPSSDLLITVAAGGGRSESHSNQARRQNVSGPPGTPGYQDQIDPTRCCGVTQMGGENNSMDINQAGSQKSNQGAEQVLALIGECNTTNGTCTATHHARNDDDQANFSDSCGSTEDPCPITLITLCESEAAFEGTGSGKCAPPEDFLLIGPGFFTGTSLLPGTPLSGFEVTMGLVEPDLSVLP